MTQPQPNERNAGQKMWDKTKAGAKKLTYKATISVKQRNILGVKQRLGVGVYAAFEEHDEAFARELFLKAQAKIASLENEIINCELKIAEKCDPKYVPRFVPSTAPPRTYRTDRKKPLGGSTGNLQTDGAEPATRNSNQNMHSPNHNGSNATEVRSFESHNGGHVDTKESSTSFAKDSGGHNNSALHNRESGDNFNSAKSNFQAQETAQHTSSAAKDRESHTHAEHRSATTEYVITGGSQSTPEPKNTAPANHQAFTIPYSKSAGASASQTTPNNTSSSDNVITRPASLSQRMPPSHKPHLTPVAAPSSPPKLSSSYPASSSLSPKATSSASFSAPSSVPNSSPPASASSSFSSNNCSSNASSSASSLSATSPKSGSSSLSPTASSKQGANWGAAESASKASSPARTEKSSPRAQSPSPRAQSPSPRSSSSPTGPVSGVNALLLWAQQSTEGYNGVDISNFTTSWKSGISYAALLYAHEPRLLDITQLDASKPTATCQVAFDAAEKAGVAILIDAEDMAIGDKKCIIVQLQMYHKALSHSPPSHAGREAWNRQFR